jgi:hypothetical protein
MVPGATTELTAKRRINPTQIHQNSLNAGIRTDLEFAEEDRRRSGTTFA